jgi:hypothetical protein
MHDADRQEWEAMSPEMRGAYLEAALAQLRQAGRTTTIGLANRMGSIYRAHMVREAVREMEREGAARVVGVVTYHDHHLPVYELRDADARPFGADLPTGTRSL